MNKDKVYKSDLYRYRGTFGMIAFIKAWRSPTFRFLFFFRIVTRSRKYTPKWILAFYFYRRLFLRYGLQVPTSVKIGKGLLLPHFGGIVINSGTEIGDNCNILQNVTFGNTKGGKNPGCPKLGSRVYVGPGALIVGGVKIGDDVMIVGNSFVNMDVPSNSIVIGNPAKIIEKKESQTEGYINNLSQ